MSGSTWVTGLRELADWLEQNPDLQLRNSRCGSNFRLAREHITVKDAHVFAERHGFGVEDFPDDDHVVREAACGRTFGPLLVEVWGISLDDLPDLPPTRWTRLRRASGWTDTWKALFPSKDQSR